MSNTFICIPEHLKLSAKKQINLFYILETKFKHASYLCGWKVNLDVLYLLRLKCYH